MTWRRWRSARLVIASLALVGLPAAIALGVAQHVDPDLERALYTGAVTLIFGGLLGGVLEMLLENVATARRSDIQRAHEEKVRATLQRYATSSAEPVPRIENEPWDHIHRHFPRLNDLIGGAGQYEKDFATPLHDASKALRRELAAILGGPPYDARRRAGKGRGDR